LACVACNASKDNTDLETWLRAKFGPRKAAVIAKRVLARAKAPFVDAAAVNSTRWALYQGLTATGLPVLTGSGGQTKWNRSRSCVPKSHTLDAICVGDVNKVASYPDTVVVAKATGRGSYARTRPDSNGFPRLHMPRAKTAFGFQTGDLVRAVVPRGKHAGAHIGRVAVRSSGSFDITTTTGTVQGISHRYCTALQRADGWGWSRQAERNYHDA